MLVVHSFELVNQRLQKRMLNPEFRLANGWKRQQVLPGENDKDHGNETYAVAGMTSHT